MKYNRIQKIQDWRYIGLLLVCIFAFYAGGYAQDGKTALVDFYLDKGPTGEINKTTSSKLKTIVALKKGPQKLVQALRSIAHQAGLKLSYSKQVIPFAKKITIKKEKLTAEQALRDALEGTGYRFGISASGQLVLVKMQTPSPSFQQETITGTVTDGQSGETLPGVNILVKGTSTGTSTDENGTYELTVESLQDTLVFTFIGYQTRQVPINGRTEISIKMKTQAISGEEMVIVGYGTQKRSLVTSAISSVSGDELSVQASSDPLMGLQGKVAGLSIQNTAAADPNSRPTIQLRGVTTRSDATSPLIVINGVPGGNLLNVNENDIKSIDVLKDGAATAIYGTRASNGVILITTKKATKGQNRVSYDGFVNFDTPTMALSPLSSSKFKAHDRGTDFGANTDWMDLITNKYAFTQKHTLSFMGGGDNTSYRVTIDYQNSNGLDITSNRKEYGARLAINHTGGDGLYNITLNVAPRVANPVTIDKSVFNEGLLLNPTAPVIDPSNQGRYYAFGGYDEFNPVEELKLHQNGSEQKFLDWNSTLKLNFLPNLSSEVQIAQVSSDNFDYSYAPSTMTTQILAGQEGTGSRNYNKYDQYSLEWLAHYNLDFKNHSFKLLGVYSYQYFKNSSESASNRNFPTDATTYNNLGNGTYNQRAGRSGFDTFKEDSKLISFRGRLNYSYNNKYLFTASLTRDGSSKFGANNKWGYFPGFSVGWRLGAEPFMQNVEWITDLKIRADYGETGNQAAVNNYQSLARYQGFGQYEYKGDYIQVWGPANNVNPNLRWEKLKNWNLGLDFALFNDRINGTINYYRRRAVDLLGNYDAPVPPNIVPTTVANVGTMESKGVEVDLNGSIINKKEFNYNFSLNVATQNAVFESFSNDLYKGQDFVDQIFMPAPGSPGPSQRLQEGKRVGMFYMWKYAGVDKEGNFLFFNKEGKKVPAREAKQDDKQFVGNGQPKFIASMGHTFQYKNWDASVLVRGVLGWDIFNVHEFYYGLQSAAKNTNVLPSAYGRNAKIKSLPLLSDYFLERGDFVKLQEVSIGYRFDKLKLKYVRSVRLYGSARNLFTLTAFNGVDPDLYPVNGLNPGIFHNGNSGTKAYYPSTSQFLIGVQIKF